MNIDLHEAIFAGILVLLGKIVWDWLTARREAKENGHLEATIARMEILLQEMSDRQKKMWEYMLGHRDEE